MFRPCICADGDLDVYIGNTRGPNEGLINDGAGGFSSTIFSSRDDNTFAVAAGDVDGDTDLDLLVVNSGVANELLLNEVSGVFKADEAFSDHDVTETSVFAVGDVNGDSFLDLFVGNLDQPSELWLNDGSGVMTLSLTFPSASTRAAAFGDVDRDGGLLLGRFFTAPAKPHSSLWPFRR